MRQAADLYEVLGVSRSASAEQIKKAFRRLAREHHPDANQGSPEAEERFKVIQQAYAVLSDPERRRAHDLADRYEPARYDRVPYTAPPAPGGFPARFPERGQDIHTHVWLTFEQSLQDTEVQLDMLVAMPCPRCAGQGVIVSVQAVPCPQCAANGSVREKRELQVLVPAGAFDGQELLFEGYGHGGRFDGPPGDLYLTVYVQASEWFVREGDQLVLDVPLTVEEAIAGAVIEVPTLDARKRIRVPAGTQPGTRQRLAGAGVPLEGGERGDLILRFSVQIPAARTDEQRAATRALGDALRLLDPRAELWPPDDAQP